jgi:hypothetical protein
VISASLSGTVSALRASGLSSVTVAMPSDVSTRRSAIRPVSSPPGHEPPVDSCAPVDRLVAAGRSGELGGRCELGVARPNDPATSGVPLRHSDEDPAHSAGSRDSRSMTSGNRIATRPSVAIVRRAIAARRRPRPSGTPVDHSARFRAPRLDLLGADAPRDGRRSR